MALLLFYWGGYQWLFAYLQRQADTELNARLDGNDYREADLLELRIPLNNPYQNNTAGFERSYGEVRHQGQVYTYVKRKVENGVLILQCIPNTGKSRIQSAGHDLARANSTTDGDAGGKPLPLKGLKNTLTEFDEGNFAALTRNSSEYTRPGVPPPCFHLPPGCASVPDHPPCV